MRQFFFPISGTCSPLNRLCIAFNCPNTNLANPDTFLWAFRGAPLPSIAQWISGLFGNVDLAPSDITAALVLAAAAQRRRRKNRIKKALNPIMKAASNAATSNTTDQVSDLDTASVDEREWLLAVPACCLHACFPVWLAVGSTFAFMVSYIGCVLGFRGCICSHSAAHNASSNPVLHFVLPIQVTVIAYHQVARVCLRMQCFTAFLMLYAECHATLVPPTTA